jgi:hypothetical protein
LGTVLQFDLQAFGLFLQYALVEGWSQNSNCSPKRKKDFVQEYQWGQLLLALTVWTTAKRLASGFC